jgi:hypothetical protein
MDKKHGINDTMYLFLTNVIVPSFGILIRELFPGNDVVVFVTMYLAYLWLGVLVADVDVSFGYVIAMAIPILVYTFVGSHFISSASKAFIQLMCTSSTTSINKMFSHEENTLDNKQ